MVIVNHSQHTSCYLCVQKVLDIFILLLDLFRYSHAPRNHVSLTDHIYKGSNSMWLRYIVDQTIEIYLRTLCNVCTAMNLPNDTVLRMCTHH
jgi:hypothetical protein